MSDDWQVGDLALCVSHGPEPEDWLENNGGPQLGEIIRVSGVAFYPEDDTPEGIYLSLDGYEDEFFHAAFRKVTPPEADEFDRQVIEQMNGAPVGEPVA